MISLFWRVTTKTSRRLPTGQVDHPVRLLSFLQTPLSVRLMWFGACKEPAGDWLPLPLHLLYEA